MDIRAAFLVAAVGASAAAAQAPVRVLSFNIRYGTANDGDHRWPNRSAHVIATIRDHAPHILGIQEALRGQLDEIARAAPLYRELGVGRDDGKTAGEYAALLVDTTRFAVASNGHFWYSNTPDVPGSKHWGNNVTRICTWARLVDRTSGDTLRVYNTHWDHESQPSRQKSATALLERIVKDGSPRDRLLVLADFNSDEENEAFKAVITDPRAGLHDTFRELHPDALNVGTFHGFKGDSSGGKIDAVLAGTGWLTVDATIDRRKFGALWASDHFAVSATLRPMPIVSGLAALAPALETAFPSGASRLHTFADFDSDGSWDGFFMQAAATNQFFARRRGSFSEVVRHGLPSLAISAVAWGNITRPELPPLDRFSDLVVGLQQGGVRLLHNRGADSRAAAELRWSGLEDITRSAGLDSIPGRVKTLQLLDFDGDFDIDLFIGFEDRPPALYAAKPVSGLTGGVRFERRAVTDLVSIPGTSTALWFDYDMDGDLDLLYGGRPGIRNGMFVSNGGRYADVGRNTPLEWAGRTENVGEEKNTGICAGDVNRDGLIDLFFTNHGRNALLISQGPSSFLDATVAWNVAERGYYEGCSFGDIDNDGQLDLLLVGTREKGAAPLAFVLRNTGGQFIDATPPDLGSRRGITSGTWIDVDRDGDLDLTLTGTSPGMFENHLDSAVTERSLAVRVRDVQDFMTLTGAEVKVYSSADRRLIATRIVGDGGAASVHNDVPLHFGIPNAAEVDVEVIYPRGDRRLILRIEAVQVAAYRGRALTMRMPSAIQR